MATVNIGTQGGPRVKGEPGAGFEDFPLNQWDSAVYKMGKNEPYYLCSNGTIARIIMAKAYSDLQDREDKAGSKRLFLCNAEGAAVSVGEIAYVNLDLKVKQADKRLSGV
jgi:hypothetical protein